jgi:hypothetical protein
MKTAAEEGLLGGNNEAGEGGKWERERDEGKALQGKYSNCKTCKARRSSSI